MNVAVMTSYNERESTAQRGRQSIWVWRKPQGTTLSFYNSKVDNWRMIMMVEGEEMRVNERQLESMRVNQRQG
jgi:hypothetical protein